MNEYYSSNKRVITPKDVVNTLRKSWKQYRFGRQEDAHEFLVMFLQGVLKASFGNSAKLIKKYEHLTMVYRIFAGKLRSQVKCLSCGYCSDSFEPFLALSLDVAKGNTFEECIRHFCAPETLEGDNKYQCSGCSKLSKAKKRMTIFKPPRILTVHFLRFTMTGRKINKHITFPKSFNLRVFVSENVDSKLPKDQQSNHIYSLYGVIVHAGKSSKCGHYYSFVKHGDKWYMCNDERITEVRDIDQVLKQNAYMLVYKYKVPTSQKSSRKGGSKAEDTASLNLSKTKSISIEIKESLENKNRNYMPLSGFIEEDKAEANSEEEEEKLTKKEDLSKEQQEKFDKLDYILANFEDIDLQEIKNLDIMRNLSCISLSDENIKTPELKTYISNTLSLKKKQASKVIEQPQLNGNHDSNDAESDIKIPSTPSRKRKRSDALETNDEVSKGASTPKNGVHHNKRESKAIHKGDVGSALDDSTKPNTDHEDKSPDVLNSSKKAARNKRRRERKKNKNNNGAAHTQGSANPTNRKFDNLVRKILSSN